jgi:hypothetical protein
MGGRFSEPVTKMDTLNIVPLMDNKMKSAFSVFSPRKMMVSRNDGRINHQMIIDKDNILGIHSIFDD